MPAQPSISATKVPPVVGQHTRCQACGCKLGVDEFDDVVKGYCSSCRTRPEIRRILDGGSSPRPVIVAGKGQKPAEKARDFTVADLDLIRSVHGYMPHMDLLKTLNERLRADVGGSAVPYTLEQLHAAIESVGNDKKKDGPDWASLRKILAHAKRSGLLAKIDEPLIDVFAVVFRLNAGQVLHLKDALMRRDEE